MVTMKLLGLITPLLAAATAAAAITNGTNSTTALYKDPSAPIDARVSDLVGRMNITEKMAQLMQGDISNWLNTNDGTFNRSGLIANMETKAGQFYVGYPVPYSWIADNVLRAQKYLVEETRLGIPALVQSEGIHGFLIGNATIFNSPIAYACSFDPEVSMWCLPRVEETIITNYWKSLLRKWRGLLLKSRWRWV
jgi:beta-glucosidase